MRKATFVKVGFVAALGAGAVVLGCAGATSAAVIQVDFNDAGTDPGAGWNVIADAQRDVTGLALSDTNGNGGYTLDISGDFSKLGIGSNHNETGAFVGTDFEDAAADYAAFGGDNTPESGTLTFGGLDPNTAYTLELVASRATSGARVGDYTVGGNFTTNQTSSDDYNTNTDGFTNGDLLIFNTTSDSNGQVALTASVTGDNFAYVNAVRLSSVPEPASLALMGLGGLALIGRRRRRGTQA